MKFQLRFVCLLALLIPVRMSAVSFSLSATLSPIPGVQTDGGGSGAVSVSDDFRSVFAVVAVGGLRGPVASGTGIYGPAPAGQDGPLIFAFNVPFPSFTDGVLTGEFSLNGTTDELFKVFLDGLAYILIVTNQPGATSEGFSAQVIAPELRGQLFLDPFAPGPGAGVVPEPGTWSMLGLGLGVVAWKFRRRRAQR
jgi:hypothetical protein